MLTQVLVILKTVVQVVDNQVDIVIKLVLLHKVIHLNILEQDMVTPVVQLIQHQDTLVVAEAVVVSLMQALDDATQHQFRLQNGAICGRHGARRQCG